MSSGNHPLLPIVGGSPAPNPLPPLPTVEALEALWEKLHQRRLWAPPRTFKYLRLRWKVRLTLLDPHRVKLLGPRYKLNDCHHCTDMCCVGPRSTVLLRLRDIAMLVDIGRTDLIDFNKPKFDRADLNALPALARQVSSSAWETFPVLKQNHMSACQALSTDGKCTIFPTWPLACARFPYALHADTEEVFYSQRCDSFWVRPDAEEPVRQMAQAAVQAYNERIKDRIMLEFARPELDSMGLTRWLNLSE